MGTSKWRVWPASSHGLGRPQGYPPLRIGSQGNGGRQRPSQEPRQHGCMDRDERGWGEAHRSVKPDGCAGSVLQPPGHRHYGGPGPGHQRRHCLRLLQPGYHRSHRNLHRHYAPENRPYPGHR